jgi:hypothetical protein
MMQYYRSHPFKALPVTRSTSSKIEKAPLKRPPKKVTKPAPFRLKTDERRLTLQSISSDICTKEAEDIKEMKKQFRAKPAPKFAPTAMAQLSRFPTPGPLTPSPGHLTPSSVSVNANAPNLSTPARSAKRQAVTEASRRKTEAMALRREQEVKARQREKIREDVLRFEASRISVPASAKPFTLHSELRGEQHQRKFEEQIRIEEGERRRMSAFHALEYHKSSPPPERKRPERIVTEVQPFKLISVTRHEEYAVELERKRAERDEKLKQLSECFKASPVPKSTYSVTPIVSPKPKSTPRSVGSSATPR